MAIQQQLTGAMQVVVSLTRSVALKRALAAADPDPALNFWRVLHGHLLDMAVLEWCKLFGSDDEEHQRVHWKNIFPDEAAFRAGLFAQLGVDQVVWRRFWQQVKTYRDQRVAHFDLDQCHVPHFPDLDRVLASAFYYYNHLIAGLREFGETRFPDDLSTYYEAFLAQATAVAVVATGSTRGIREQVQ